MTLLVYIIILILVLKMIINHTAEFIYICLSYTNNIL
jgi:hypothetical protein